MTRTTPLAIAATLGTLPYLTLKLLWLTGHPVGVDDPALIGSPSMVALNVATVGMDLAVVVLAIALTSAWGRRLPAVAVLLPAWVATGLLVPIALAGLPASAVAAVAGGDPLGLAAWVRPMVYGGFTWQAVFLLAAFALYARERWSVALRRPAPASGPVAALLRACVGGGVATAVLSAGLAVLGGVSDGGWVPVLGGVTNAVFALFGAGGVLALARRRSAGPVAPDGRRSAGVVPPAGERSAGTTREPVTGRARRAAVLAGWTGSAVLFAGGLWSAVTTMGTTDLAGSGNPAAGLGQLTGLLAGFALAVAGLLAVSGPGSDAASNERQRADRPWESVGRPGGRGRGAAA